MTAPNPAEGHRLRSFANVLDGILNHETPDQRWLRLAGEKLERDRANEENRRG